MITDITVTDKLVVFAPNISIWSARKKMQAEDYGFHDLPPEDLCSLGVKKLCPQEKLRIFSTLRARAVSVLSRYGVPFIPGAWFIPSNRVSDVEANLKSIQEEFEDAKCKFLADYDSICQDWLDQHPEFREMLQKSMASSDYVRSRISFGWRAFVLKSDSDIENIGNSVFADIARDAKSIFREVFATRDSVTQKALRPITQLGEKLRGLAFIHPQVGAASDLVKSCLRQMPSKGIIQGTNLGLLLALITLLSNPAALEAATEKMLSGTEPVSLLISQNAVSDLPEEESIAVNPIIPQQQSVITNVGLW